MTLTRDRDKLTDQAIRPPRVSFSYAAFAPGETALISGAPMALHRRLREIGFLRREPDRRHPRFDVFGLCYLQAAVNLTEIVGIERAHQVAQRAAYGIAWAVLADRDSYAGDRDRVFEWDPDMFARIEAWRAATALVRKPGIGPGEVLEEIERVGPADGVNGATQTDWLRERIFRQRRCYQAPGRFMVVRADRRSFAWAPSLDAAFDGGLSGDRRFAGPVAVLDQEALATQIIDRAGRPFVTVEIGGAS